MFKSPMITDVAIIEKPSKCVYSIQLSKDKKSSVWNYFGLLKENERILSTDYYYCRLCLDKVKGERLLGVKKYKRNVSTGNLAHHLDFDHEVKKPNRPEASQKQLESYFNTMPNCSRNDGCQRNKLQTSDINLWFAKDILPFSTIEKEGLHDFLMKYGVIETPRECPSAYTLSRDLTRIFNNMEELVKNLILTDSHDLGTVTVDTWTSKHRRRSYIGYTYHYINKEYIMKSVTLRAQFLEEKHSGENIENLTKAVEKDFGLEGKIKFFISDQGSNMVRFARIGERTRLSCDGHALHHLVTTDGICRVEKLAAVVVKIKNIVRSLAFRSEELLRLSADLKDADDLLNNLNDQYEDVELDEMFSARDYDSSDNIPTTLKQECPTRWSSTLTMLESIRKNYKGVTRLLECQRKYDLILNDDECRMMTDLIGFLQSFKTATEILSGQNYPTLNLAVLFREELSNHFEVQPNDPKYIKDLKKKMKEKFGYRLPLVGVHVVAAILDPSLRFMKTVTNYLSDTGNSITSFLEQTIQQLHLTLNTAAAANQQEENTSDTEVCTVQSSWKRRKLELVEKYCNRPASDDGGLDAEVNKYMTMSVSTHQSIDVLSWWRTVGDKCCPRLGQLARTIFCIPATSTPIERVWSVAGLVVTSKRSSLRPDRVNKLIFIHDNYSICKQMTVPDTQGS